MLIEETNVPDAALPVAAFKAHMRLGTGFGEDTLQDVVLGSFLRAAMAAIEARTGKVLMEREFTLVSSLQEQQSALVLSVAPVTAIVSLQRISRSGAAEVISSDAYWLDREGGVPRLRPTGTCLPLPETGGELRVQFLAGFGPEWDDIPADMQQAVLMLAAHYYEYRHDTALSDGCMPFGVTSLIERFRTLRMGRSGAAI
ncbi:head-tail connector protein [Sulfitobacter donghicola]|uniref:Gene transfer agent protein n=1 Tax=Sulfitobacter donghicola DSW-25 = KCTC 12864 = JCM 14565 TaxID=1300350 RepID=A0A073IKC6_9RHOB|nr:head-tail connector protein [Sulfitobacter donghicola]KEJ90204.1 gene transfer agent protein [Sulfitobacter donghicola DSW-25 = KCTC 12864 = JCM 14565]KIN66628.1 putative GTA protein [Sulfitobacter donghicola DSW-25 = KCTC 12864 = JCM 14565]